MLREHQVDGLALQLAHGLVLIDGQTLQLPPCLNVQFGESGQAERTRFGFVYHPPVRRES
jgi:hypothetical protein